MRSFFAAAILLFCIPSALASTSQKEDLPRAALSILKAHCIQCHGAERHEANLRLDTQALSLKGGFGGPAIIPGKGAKSLLIQRIQGVGNLPRMPMGFSPLPPTQVNLLIRWIDAGAPFSAGSAKKHWAYIRPVKSHLPAVKQAHWIKNPIDRFVLARLERSGLAPSPTADREILLRRVSLDLTGLPPTLEEQDAFLKDSSPGAYEKAVDRLLASPHFGERWARLWLDLARYADTNGYEKDDRRSIWPYRDWVIRAFNQDMPFDRFTITQLAGDLLPNATIEDKIATGFQRNTMLNEEGGVDRDEQRWLTQIDRVGTTGAAWLGSTIACAQCHNHKYDPFSQKEFYQLLAYYDRTREPSLEVPEGDQLEQRKKLQAEIKTLEADLKTQTDQKAQEVKLTELKTSLEERKKALEAIHIPTTLVFEEQPASELKPTFLRIKGSYLSKGELVQPGVPAVLNKLPAGSAKNRLALARWLVSRDNPLTARVLVNRLWEQLFGRGIVETSDDFGTQGTPPTHPELLDWMAVDFMERGWSIKKTLRLMVTSAAYRQSSRFTPKLLEKDPYNRLLSRGPRFRLEAEMLRDQALSAAGLLNPKIGGPSVFPVQPDGVWVIPYNGDQWTTETGGNRYRRGLYTFWRRTSPYPAFVTFDATSREYCTTRRIRTSTPLQALTLLNDQAFFEAAQALARRMETAGSDPKSRIALGVRLCTGRHGSEAQLSSLIRLYNKELRRFQMDRAGALKLAGTAEPAANTAERAAMTIVANVLLNLDETITKE